jgi:type II secretion system protein N
MISLGVMKTTKKILAWVFYISVLTVVFLYLLFPSDAVRKYLQHEFEKAGSGAVFLDIQSLSPGFPPALLLDDVILIYNNINALGLDRVTLSPAYAKLLQKNRALNFRADIGDGNASGWLQFENMGEKRPELSFDLEFENVDARAFEIIKNLTGKSVSGSLEGEFVFNGGIPGQTGKGSAQIRGRQFTVGLQPPVMGVQELTFRYLQADLEIENQRLDISGLKVDGSQFSGEGNGRLLIRQPLENSQIQLSLLVKLHPALIKTLGGILPKKYLKEKGIPVRISGTLNQPSWSVR